MLMEGHAVTLTMPIDPHADRFPARVAALPTAASGAATQCAECRSSRNCGTHWQYLLSNQATRVNLQCPGCATLWSIDTRNR